MTRLRAWVRLPAGRPRPGTALAVGGLVTVWIWFASTRWARWGDVTIDSGREAYVPWLLSHGRVLYRDVWYPHGPLGPYVNAALMRVFGATFTTLYVAGLLALVVQALALYACGSLLGSRLAGFGAGLVVLLQSVHHSLFSFPFPYAYDAVYGATIAALVAVSLLLTLQRDSGRWLVVMASLAALAFLAKLEYGAASYAAVAGTLALRQYGRRSSARLRRDIVAVVPGLAVCVVVVGWMVSLRGYEFITNENIQSWPGTHFMRTYGAHWLRLTGGSAPFTEVLRVAGRAASYVALWLLLRATVVAYLRTPRRQAQLGVLAGATIGTGFLVVAAEGWGTASLRALVLPSNLLAVLALVTIPVAQALRSEGARRDAMPLLALLAFAILVGARAAFGFPYFGYSIYYNGLATAALLVVVTRLPNWSARAPTTIATTARAALVVPVAWLMAQQAIDGQGIEVTAVEVASDRGSLGIPLDRLATYQAALEFMHQAHAQGDVVLVVPEDTTLYFLAGIEAPTRANAFTPGLVTPGRMTEETIAQVEAAQVRYLLVSSRTFTEYGTPLFGVDFANELGDYLLSNYREVGPLIDRVDSFPTLSTYSMTIWERIER